MNSLEAVFEIIDNNKCPFYKHGDVFCLSGKALLLDQKKAKTFISTTIIKFPYEKSSCRILIEDLSEILIKYKSVDRIPELKLYCSGCSGLVRLEYKGRQPNSPGIEDKYDIEVIESLLSNFSFFKVLDENDIRKLVPFLKMKKYNKGENIIKKGDPGRNLYIIVSGTVEVLGDSEIIIAFLGKGEVFGEMSLLSGDPATATVRVADTVKILYIDGNDFRRLLNKSSSLQMYFNRLLSRRLAEVNVLRSQEFYSGMVGNLSEMPPSDLFQIFHVNQKTGILSLVLLKGKADLAFRDGDLVRAEYYDKNGREAFYEILKEKQGRFKFVQGLGPQDMQSQELGDFTWLLMDGIRQIDEEMKLPDKSYC